MWVGERGASELQKLRGAAAGTLVFLVGGVRIFFFLSLGVWMSLRKNGSTGVFLASNGRKEHALSMSLCSFCYA